MPMAAAVYGPALCVTMSRIACATSTCVRQVTNSVFAGYTRRSRIRTSPASYQATILILQQESKALVGPESRCHTSISSTIFVRYRLKRPATAAPVSLTSSPVTAAPVMPAARLVMTEMPSSGRPQCAAVSASVTVDHADGVAAERADGADLRRSLKLRAGHKEIDALLHADAELVGAGLCQRAQLRQCTSG